jgi:zinc protease
VMVIGFAGTTVHSPDRFALELIQEACSDLGSRLFLRVREKLGLAYYVGAQNVLGLAPAYFAFYVGTDPAKADLVQVELLAEAEALRREGLAPDELQRAKAKIIGQKKIARQDLGGYAAAVALDELYGLGYQHSDHEDAEYQAVTVEETRRVSEKYLREDALVVVLLRPEESPAST